MKKRRSIKKELLKTDKPFVEKRIAVLGGSTTHDIIDILELFLLNYGIRPTFYESEFNQYWQDAMFDNPKLDEFKQQYASDGKGVPVFSIMFGDADSQQLNDLAKLSNGKVFDGRNGNLSGIFREVKGYN